MGLYFRGKPTLITKLYSLVIQLNVEQFTGLNFYSFQEYRKSFPVNVWLYTVDRKIPWAKYSRFQCHQSFCGNIFALPWP